MGRSVSGRSLSLEFVITLACMLFFGLSGNSGADGDGNCPPT